MFFCLNKGKYCVFYCVSISAVTCLGTLIAFTEVTAFNSDTSLLYYPKNFTWLYKNEAYPLNCHAIKVCTSLNIILLKRFISPTTQICFERINNNVD